MRAMTTWHLSVTVATDRPVTDDDARRISHLQGADQVAMNGNRLTLAATVDVVDVASPLHVLQAHCDGLTAALAATGYQLVDILAVEALTPSEVERRLATAGIPPMIDVKAFAQLCGVATQRIYELETERRKATAEGRSHPFPPPVVPGWWLRSAAEHYAQTRRTKPGPAPKNEQ
jgi:hypothetical protein